VDPIPDPLLLRKSGSAWESNQPGTLTTRPHRRSNRPDLIIENKKEKICTLIDVSMPSYRNVTHKEAENKIRWAAVGTRQ
jgi:hypothetical protein